MVMKGPPVAMSRQSGGGLCGPRSSPPRRSVALARRKRKHVQDNNDQPWRGSLFHGSRSPRSDGLRRQARRSVPIHFRPVVESRQRKQGSGESQRRMASPPQSSPQRSVSMRGGRSAWRSDRTSRKRANARARRLKCEAQTVDVIPARNTAPPAASDILDVLVGSRRPVRPPP